MNLMAHRTVTFTVHADIGEGKMAVTLGVHNETNVPMDTLQVAKEQEHLAWIVGPDDESVVHVSRPAEVLVVRNLQTRFLKDIRE
jgi:hypothetical protein